ncbi:MAG TPA: Imm8 family immunity protein [Terriglobales bacterium]|nr:Imm8 family immunity protein [Terriglobales bacterium]
MDTSTLQTHLRAELKRFDSPDIALFEECPGDPESFCFLVAATIGVAGKDGGDLFDFIVCSPKWLIANRTHEGAVFGHHLLIVFEYDPHIIEGKLKWLCARTTGSSWEQIALKLSQYGHWEFEGYRPVSPGR